MKQFPKKYFAKIEKDSDCAYPVFEDKMEHLVFSIGVTERIAVYQLVEVIKVTGTLSFEKVK